MILHYEFGGDDDNPGEDWDHEIDYQDVEKAVAYIMPASLIPVLVRKTNASSDQRDKLIKMRPIFEDIIQIVLHEFDLVSDTLEEDFRDDIESYYENEAYEEWLDCK